MDADGLFHAMDIRVAIGDLVDGQTVDLALLPSIRAAITGGCPTADRGEQVFVVGVMQAVLFNVDTAELIWPREPEHPLYDANDGLLRVVTDPQLWKRACGYWDAVHPREWTAFI